MDWLKNIQKYWIRALYGGKRRFCSAMTSLGHVQIKRNLVIFPSSFLVGWRKATIILGAPHIFYMPLLVAPPTLQFFLHCSCSLLCSLLFFLATNLQPSQLKSTIVASFLSLLTIIPCNVIVCGIFMCIFSLGKCICPFSLEEIICVVGCTKPFFFCI